MEAHLAAHREVGTAGHEDGAEDAIVVAIVDEPPIRELRRLIREVGPPTPSTRLNTLQDRLTAVASQRRTDPRQLLRTVRGELDWIVMKCLEKDRNRRYEAARGLARDIECYLTGVPVLAHPHPADE